MLSAVVLYRDEMMSIPQVAEATSMPRTRVRQELLRAGVLRSRGDGVRLRAPAIGDALRGRARTFTPEWKANIAAAAAKHWEGLAVGLSRKASGYVVYTTGPNKNRGVHTVKMEEVIGRRIRRNEVVHHIDRQRDNNDLDNLALMTRAAHQRLHRFEDRLAKTMKEIGVGRVS